MKKQSIIRIFLVVAIIAATVFVVAAMRTKTPLREGGDECMQDKQERVETRTQSEFLLEAITRNLLGR
jgi:hypothetical protein